MPATALRVLALKTKDPVLAVAETVTFTSATLGFGAFSPQRRTNLCTKRSPFAKCRGTDTRAGATLVSKAFLSPVVEDKQAINFVVGIQN